MNKPKNKPLKFKPKYYNDDNFANTRAEFYYQCKIHRINFFLDYDYSWNGLIGGGDVIVDENRNIVADVRFERVYTPIKERKAEEEKSSEMEGQPELNSVKTFFCWDMDCIPGIVAEVEKILKQTKHNPTIQREPIKHEWYHKNKKERLCSKNPTLGERYIYDLCYG